MGCAHGRRRCRLRTPHCCLVDGLQDCSIAERLAEACTLGCCLPPSHPVCTVMRRRASLPPLSAAAWLAGVDAVRLAAAAQGVQTSAGEWAARMRWASRHRQSSTQKSQRHGTQRVLALERPLAQPAHGAGGARAHFQVPQSDQRAPRPAHRSSPGRGPRASRQRRQRAPATADER